jgi:hypothetical protein
MRRSKGGLLMKTFAGFAAAALVLSSMTTFAVEPPPMKEGLWSIHSETVTNASTPSSNASTICRSHSYDQKVREKMKSMPGCKTASETLQGNEWSMRFQCTVQGSVIDTISTVTFTDNSAHSEVHASYKPALQGITEMTMKQEQKYLGACPAGMKPGDIKPVDTP